MIDVLSHLNHIFQLVAVEKSSDEEAIASLIASSEIAVPDEYLNLVLKNSEFEFAVSNTCLLYTS